MFESTDVVVAELIRKNTEGVAHVIEVVTGMCYRFGIAAQTIGEAAEKIAHSASVVALAYTASVAPGAVPPDGAGEYVARMKAAQEDVPDPPDSPWLGIDVPKNQRFRFAGLPGYPEKP